MGKLYIQFNPFIHGVQFSRILSIFHFSAQKGIKLITYSHCGSLGKLNIKFHHFSYVVEFRHLNWAPLLIVTKSYITSRIAFFIFLATVQYVHQVNELVTTTFIKWYNIWQNVDPETENDKNHQFVQMKWHLTRRTIGKNSADHIFRYTYTIC